MWAPNFDVVSEHHFAMTLQLNLWKFLESIYSDSADKGDLKIVLLC